ncbi:ATP-binding protein [Brevundimonas lutea]|uniref:ATP-binding protein n=1 Tax=Brevundimonas lutea TaxID=2293980 RepID=UPI000F035BD8|nr:ATP-binding protein [Brevundimonas lutea]
MAQPAASAYGVIAAGRTREMPTRLLLAVFIGVTAWFLAPGPIPMLWFGLVFLGQGLDWWVFRPFRRDPTLEGRGWRALVPILGMTTNAIVYSGLAIYLWFEGGPAGQIFGLIQVSGSLLHVSYHMNSDKGLLLAGCLPPGAYFLGLPLISAVAEREPRGLLIMIGGVLYLAHLVASVRRMVSQTKHLEAARAEAEAQSARAETASAAKSDFLAVISHEIRTPMNAVISAANLLRRTRLSADQKEHVGMLLDAGDVLVGLLNDVLDFSKIEAGKMELEAADMPLRPKVAALARLWEPKANAKGVRLHIEVDSEAPEIIRTDPLRLQQILFNLLSNAVKFTREGDITVRVMTTGDAGRLAFEVQDSGVGIPADRLEQVFASFEQASVGTTRRYGGTGLGLAISRRLAEVMGGALTVTSVMGEGSLFRLELPVAVAAGDADRAKVVPEGASLQGRHILAAEDHEVNRRILKLLLEPHGCVLTLVENGQEAVEAARVQRFDAILMDMQMPVMDGLDATRGIRAGGANARTPVVALTANAMDTHRAAWAAVGVEAFLTKPIDPELLALTLSRACAEGRKLLAA